MPGPDPDPVIRQSLVRLGLLPDPPSARFTPLTGGVSSDIWKVETVEGTLCVKRALAKLKVQADWHAPVERNRFEVAWCRIANGIVPGVAPEILGHDDDAMLLAMTYLDPATHKLWKTQLRDGRADKAVAAAIGRSLAQIHAGAAADDTIAAQFPRQDIFQAIRLEPYLERTALRHPDLRDALFGLSRRTADTRPTLIHGDVSPKNILIGPRGPVFLDAECACMGDPAFDLAFCLNHLLLKCLWTPSARDRFLDCFTALADAYLTTVAAEGLAWEPTPELEARAASLLPGLFLARVDGASPVEYLTREADKDKVRQCARPLLIQPPTRLHLILDAWKEQLHR